MVTRFGSERECHVFFSESGPAGLGRPANETIPGHVNGECFPNTHSYDSGIDISHIAISVFDGL